MSGPWGEPRSNSPNAPQISSQLYTLERGIFTGHLIGTIVYGIAVALFFQCIGALINPINTMRKSVKWGLVAHTVALFLFLTVGFMTNRYIMFTEYIDNRDFPGDDEFPPGPIGYEDGFTVGPFVLVYSAMFPLGQWLCDGLLIYHCYVIYCMNYWVVVFPCLIYAASIVIGIMYIYYFPVPAFYVPPMVAKVGIAYFLICLSLNILLTLMIITRLVLHRRNIQHAMGTSDGTTKLYSTIIMMLVESYALYAIALILYIVSFALGASVTAVFAELLNGIQVIAPYLVVLRVAERRALASEAITSELDNVGSIRFRSRGTTDGDSTLPGYDPTSSMRANTEAPDEIDARDEKGIEEVPL